MFRTNVDSVSFRVLYLFLVRDTLCLVTTGKTMRDFIACVASVSSRGSSRKLWQEQKNKKNDGGGGGNPGVICSLCFYFDELSIYKWTEPWNFKGRFPESWGLRASVSSSPLPVPLQPFFRFRSNFRAITRLETLATQARDVIDLYPLYTRF